MTYKNRQFLVYHVPIFGIFFQNKLAYLKMGTDRYNYREKTGTGFEDRSLIIIVQTSTPTYILVQLTTSGFICIHLAATMFNQGHLRSDRLICMHLDTTMGN